MAAGGFLGSASRAAAGLWIGEGGFPWAVLAVNLIGSFALGFFLSRWERAVSPRGSLQFWAIGLLGSFTTFSAFSVDLVRLLDSGRLGAGGAYVGASVLGGLLCAIVGLRAGAIVG